LLGFGPPQHAEQILLALGHRGVAAGDPWLFDGRCLARLAGLCGGWFHATGRTLDVLTLIG
jgi:hypothetical protein